MDVQFELFMRFFATSNFVEIFFFFFGLCEGTGVCPPSYCRLLPKACCSVFGRSWSAKLTCAMSQTECILNIFEIGYEIHISLNFSFKFGELILILFDIKAV